MCVSFAVFRYVCMLSPEQQLQECTEFNVQSTQTGKQLCLFLSESPTIWKLFFFSFKSEKGGGWRGEEEGRPQASIWVIGILVLEPASAASQGTPNGAGTPTQAACGRQMSRLGGVLSSLAQCPSWSLILEMSAAHNYQRLAGCDVAFSGLSPSSR